MPITAYTAKLPLKPRKTYWNPSAEELRAWTFEMPNCRRTSFGAPNVQTRVLARSKLNTYLLSDHPEQHSDQCLSRSEGQQWAERQDAYIREQEMIVIDGYIGNDPEFRVPARLIIEKSNANIAGMQQQLYYPFDCDEQGQGLTSIENVSEEHQVGRINPDFEPKFTIIYTPNLKAEGFPNDRLITVDLENYVTRVFHSDYFGESKKAGLRMWNQLVYERGGLSLHAGAKVIPVGDQKKVALIVGLSGTGKTTTTFTNQNGSQPIQDDFLALMPGGKVYASENGCFAKTFGLDPNFEPAIYHATNQSEAFLENVSQDESGQVDYFDTSYTKNGRSTFRLAKIAAAADAREIEEANFLFILNRNEDIIPAVSRLGREQAAAYFMLGETKGTSAGGAAEEGKNLRVPGTNPFFPLLHAEQANRLLQLLETCNLEVYLLNTGRVGGKEGKEGSKKVKIPHSSAIVKGIAEGTIQWAHDSDFDFEVATSIPGIDKQDHDLLQPKELYIAQERLQEYQDKIRELKAERLDYMKTWAGLNQSIIDAL